MIRAPIDDAERVAWLRTLADRIGSTPQGLIGSMPFGIYGVERWGRLVGVVLWTNYRRESIEVAWAGEPGWLTRAVLRQLWAYPFRQLKVRVVTGVTKASNARARDLAVRMGGTWVGVIPDWFNDDDAVVYAMTAANCRWITDGQGRARIPGPDADRIDAVRSQQDRCVRYDEDERAEPDQPIRHIDVHV